MSGDSAASAAPAHKRGSAESQQRLRAELQRACGETLLAREPHRWGDFGLTFEVARSDALKVFSLLRNAEQLSFDMLIDITAIDWLDAAEQRFEVIYHLLSLRHLHRLCIRVRASENQPEVDSVRSIWAAAGRPPEISATQRNAPRSARLRRS